MRMQVNMMSTLWDTSKDCLLKLEPLPFDDWYCSFPAQSVIMVGCIEWTGALTADPNTSPNPSPNPNPSPYLTLHLTLRLTRTRTLKKNLARTLY